MWVRGHADGRSHPMDFAAHEYLRLAAAWVVRSATVTFSQDQTKVRCFYVACYLYVACC